MTEEGSDPLRSGSWFAQSAAAPERSTGRRAVLVRAGIGAAVGLLLLLGGHRSLAGAVWGITAAIGVASLASATVRLGLDRAFAAVGLALGRAMSVVLLAPLFVVGFGLVRLLSSVHGADPLGLRDGDAPTYWRPCDTEARKARHAGAMFATERVAGRRRPALTFAVLTLLVFAASELLLRALGFGHPILYVQDAAVGYYPAPNQEVARYGGRIRTNAFGMRAPDYAAEKAPGTLRILMLGDSTLWGASYVDQDEIYARVTEARLRQSLGGRSVEVLNAAANGWGPFHKLGYVERFGTFAADVAVICLPVWDVVRPHWNLMSHPYLTVDAPPRLAWEEVMMHLAYRLRLAKLEHRDPQDMERQAERGRAAYAQLAARLEAAGCRVLFEVLPSRWAATGAQVPPKELEQVARLRAAVETPRRPLHFPAGMFRGAGKPREIYRDGIHLDRRGHALYGSYMADRIRELLAADAPPPLTAGPSAAVPDAPGSGSDR